MITYVEGDATRPHGDGMKYIVHCCNDIGAWGSGFVLAVSARWSEPEAQYLRLWASPSLPEAAHCWLGQVQYVPVEDDIAVINLIGQHQTIGQNDEPIRYDAIWQGMRTVAAMAEANGATIHMPRMGADRARGRWSIIEAIVNEACGDIPVTVYDLPAA